MRTARLCVMGSGRGSNYAALAEAIKRGELHACIALVLSDVQDSGILSLARANGHEARFIPPGSKRTVLSPEAEQDFVAAAQNSGADLIVLAGFMRVLKPGFLQHFPRRVINIHPSLLPQFPGLRAWEQALSAGVSETGCTVHLVDEGIDTGPVLAQARVPVLPGDTPETLHKRIQKEEHRILPVAIADYWQKINFS